MFMVVQIGCYRFITPNLNSQGRDKTSLWLRPIGVCGGAVEEKGASYFYVISII